ncbi:hypothetical protein [Flammeovirga aprica]|uniref:Uncharacterized protein n=1 Tax=Flammeovirga aprica JL-4 TaxID=694437 RepID=A0A7X9S289_9BACT|nr:hypothetical protein [Flammeovirga aprica]NME73038.1 hypothetical protein [Flammeovirga aprica JL-4]
MNEKLTFDQVLKGLEKITEHTSIKELVWVIKNGDILFSPGIIQEKKNLASLYKLRVNIKKELQEDKFSKEELDNWNSAVNELDEYECIFVNLNMIITVEKIYFLFWDNKKVKLISSFWLNKEQSLNESEKNYDITIEKGYSVSSIKYSKTIKVKDWK